jgi:hypothetical protein
MLQTIHEWKQNQFFFVMGMLLEMSMCDGKIMLCFQHLMCEPEVAQ